MMRRACRNALLAILLPLLATTTPVRAEAPAAGVFAELTAPLEIVVDRDPSRIAAAKRLARLYAEAGQWDAAWRVLERSGPYALKNAEYQGFAGTVLHRMKQLPTAAAFYHRAIALQPEDGRWWVGLGLTLADAGLRKEARQAFAAARERAQTLPPALMKIAERYGD